MGKHHSSYTSNVPVFSRFFNVTHSSKKKKSMTSDYCYTPSGLFFFCSLTREKRQERSEPRQIDFGKLQWM